MGTGKLNFTSPTGVQYIIDKYLTSNDKEELRLLNTSYSQEKFSNILIEKLEKRSGGGHWIPQNYKDELTDNAAAVIGTASRAEKLKNKKTVTVYDTRNGQRVYEDDSGRIRNYATGRFVKHGVFEE